MYSYISNLNYTDHREAEHTAMTLEHKCPVPIPRTLHQPCSAGRNTHSHLDVQISGWMNENN